jgi:ribosomal protein S18 acetylase RimI-like enzyme
MDRSRVDAVERCAYDAWPAEEVFHLGGWRLRATGGVTRRGNSVWPGDQSGDLSLEERIDRVEAWYGERGLRPAFQVHALAVPEGLDAALDARGYTVDAPVSVQLASSVDAATLPLSPSLAPARVAAGLTQEWFDVSAHRGRFSATADVYRRLLERIGPRARYALVDVDGRPGAVGLGVLGAGAQMGIFSMLTVPEARRRGAGRSILRALAEAARTERRTELYLLVELANAPAWALYASASFQEVYGYHYRVKTTPP